MWNLSTWKMRRDVQLILQASKVHQAELSPLVWEAVAPLLSVVSLIQLSMAFCHLCPADKYIQYYPILGEGKSLLLHVTLQEIRKP